MLTVKILTAYPEMFPGALNHSVIGKALKQNKWSLEVINLHDFGFNRRKSIDDSPFGGGPGMIIRPDVVEKAIISITENKETNNNKLENNEKADDKKDNNVPVFGEELDIPTYLRDKNS